MNQRTRVILFIAFILAAIGIGYYFFAGQNQKEEVVRNKAINNTIVTVNPVPGNTGTSLSLIHI